jgi:hypothetical protein
VQYLPGARRFPGASRLTQWVRLDPGLPPLSLAVLVKADGRWTHVGAWGPFDAASLVSDPQRLGWFLRSFYRHAPGFLGWDDMLVRSAAAFALTSAVRMGPLPAPGRWVRLELPLDDVGATGKLVDGVAFWHEDGRVDWGRTAVVSGGSETSLWPEPSGEAGERLARTRIEVPGLVAGARVRVLFEDRELVAGAGFFEDDFRGQDLYERFGGGPGIGYGDAPVTLHAYEIAGGAR